MDLVKPAASLIGSIGSIGGLMTSAAPSAAGSFGEVLKGFMNQAVDSQKTAETLTLQAAQGNPVALQDVVQAVSQAELTLQTLVTVRDKAVEAYQQIMQMPV